MRALEEEIRRSYDAAARRHGADHRSVRYHSAASLRLDRRMVADFVRARGGRRILDVGSGWGSLTAPLAAPDRAIVGLDLSEEMARLAAARALRAAVGSALRLPVRDAVFDGALLGAIVQMHPDFAPLLDAAFRAVRPGGWVFLTNIHLASTIRRIHRAWRPGAYRPYWDHPIDAILAEVRARGLGRPISFHYEFYPLPCVAVRPERSRLLEPWAVNYGLAFERA